MIAGSWWTSRLLGGAISMGTATAPAAKATKWTRLGVPFTLQLPYTVVIIVCAGE
jgi:hypothetical protein